MDDIQKKLKFFTFVRKEVAENRNWIWEEIQLKHQKLQPF